MHPIWVLASARLERLIVIAAGVTLASCAFVLGPLPARRAAEYLLLSPPFVTGALIAGVAMSARPRVQRSLLGAIDVVMMLAAVAWGALGLVFIVPGLLVLALAAGWFQIARRGDPEERGARTGLAIGALWTIVFALLAAETGSRGVHLALVASVAMAFAGLAWRREVQRVRREQTEPPRATIRWA